MNDQATGLAALACTCAGGVDAYTACATCRAWIGVREAVERAAAMARRHAQARARPIARIGRLERRVRAVEDELDAIGITTR